MRVALLVAALLMAAASNAAAQTPAVWSQGRFSFDTTGTGWSVAAIPPEEEKMVLILQPDADAANGELRQMCLLEEKATMPPRGEATQAVANEMNRLVLQLERLDENAPGSALLEQDGVVSAYDRADLVDPQNSQPVNRQRRHFFLADGGTIRMYQFFCFAYASAGPEAPDGLRVMLERLRISGATP